MHGSAAHVNWAASRRWLTASRSVGQSAALACLIEASAPKAGNVHPAASFTDMDFSDFLASALSFAPILDNTLQRGVGQTILDAVQATRQQLDVNTNLGTLLLLVPLSLAHQRSQSLPSGRPTAPQLQTSVHKVLMQLDARDAALVYEAIRMAKPGGLGQTKVHDVHRDAPKDLLEAMSLAAEVDAVARQYVNSFSDVCGPLVNWLRSSLARGCNLLDAVCEVQLRWLANRGDGLIVRKVGREIEAQAQQLADIALQEWLSSGTRGVGWVALDTFLRADGHRRNPGTTADLIAAALFVLLTTD
jgi:triphosphoribosyl-dephospho-CoA synthase